MIRYASCVWELPMPTTFRAYQPDQPLLLPPDLQEWVPPGHLAHHVSDVVDALDLTAFYAPYEGDGRRNAPYEPSMMVKGTDLCLRDGHILLARGGEEAGGGCSVSDARGGQLPTTSVNRR